MNNIETANNVFGNAPEVKSTGFEVLFTTQDGKKVNFTVSPEVFTELAQIAMSKGTKIDLPTVERTPNKVVYAAVKQSSGKYLITNNIWVGKKGQANREIRQAVNALVKANGGVLTEGVTYGNGRQGHGYLVANKAAADKVIALLQSTYPVDVLK